MSDSGYKEEDKNSFILEDQLQTQYCNPLVEFHDLFQEKMWEN